MCKLDSAECEEDGCCGCGDECDQCAEGCCCSCPEQCCTCSCCSCLAGCCTGQCALLACFTYANLIAFLRALFLFLHTLLIACSIFGLIWSNVYFDTFDRIFLGSLVGGHLATLSAGGLLFGLSGLYAGIKHHRRLLYTHTLVTWSIVMLRGFTWLLAMLHEYPLPPLVYGVAPIELLLAFLSTMLLRDACVYF